MIEERRGEDARSVCGAGAGGDIILTFFWNSRQMTWKNTVIVLSF